MALRERIYKVFARIFRREIIRDGFRGVLGREPEAKALEAYQGSFKELGTGGVIKELSGSVEAWENIIQQNLHKILQVFYKGILGREADEEGIKFYTNSFDKKNCNESLVKICTVIFFSEENKKRVLSLFNKDVPSSIIDEIETPVFIHIQKTAGTSLGNMLEEIYGEKLYFEHADTLHAKPAAVLSKFECFSGHFNYDSLRYIPHSKKRLIAFVRNPNQRLLSLYHFLRSHSESHTIHKLPGNGATLANNLDIHEFFENKEIINQTGFWNHMTWAIMGYQTWKQWKTEITNADESEWDAIAETKRQIISQRIREFFFIGTQESFDECCKALFLKLGLSYSKDIRRDHSIEKISVMNPHIRKVERQPLDNRLENSLKKFTTLDKLIYEEVNKIKKLI